MIRHWIALKAAGVPISGGEVLGMWTRRSLTRDVVAALVIAHKAGIDFPARDIEMVELAGGNPANVVAAAIAIDRTGQTPDVKRLSMIDLAGLDVQEIGKAFARAQRDYPELTQDEFLMRTIGSNEDVVAQVRAGTFRPLGEMDGWVLRIDSPPMTGVAMLRLLEEGKVPETARIQAPNDLVWLQPAQALHRLRRGDG